MAAHEVADKSLDDVIAALSTLTATDHPVGIDAGLAVHLKSLAIHLRTAGETALDTQATAEFNTPAVGATAGPTADQWAALIKATESNGAPKNVFGTRAETFRGEPEKFRDFSIIFQAGIGAMNPNRVTRIGYPRLCPAP